MLRTMINLRVQDFIKSVLLNVVVVTALSLIIPYVLKRFMPQSLGAFVLISMACVVCTILSIYYIGFDKQERVVALSKIKQVKSKVIK